MPSIKPSTGANRSFWKQTSSGALPKDAEQVTVRRNGDGQLLPMIFRASPIARWESPDGSRVFDFRYFDAWRRG